MTIDERIEALTMNLELLSRDTEEWHSKSKGMFQQLLETARQDGENIRALARIAEIHERRLTDLEGQ